MFYSPPRGSGGAAPVFASTPAGIVYPNFSQENHLHSSGIFVVNAANDLILDAATEKAALIGRCYIEGRAASKVLSAAGGGSISFRAGAITFANGGTTLAVGIQDLDAAASAGPIARPDGTFDVSKTLTGGVDTITADAWNTIAMTGGSGSKTISHGALIAVVLDMTARAGVDSVRVQAADSSNTQPMPVINLFTASAWLGSTQRVPMCVIQFDDGTLGYLDGAVPFSAPFTETYADATNPDERGMIFRIPWDCKIDSLFMNGGANTADGDFDIALWSDPLGTPAVVPDTQISALIEQIAAATFTNRHMQFLLPAEVALSKNTDYCIAVKATGIGNVRMHGCTLGTENYRTFFPGGTTLKKATRNGGTGAFTAETPAVSIYAMGVRISSLHE